MALEGVITDKKYFNAIKKKYKYETGEFKRFAIATPNFSLLTIDWNGEATYVQSAAIVTDLGIWNNPDEFFLKYSQNFCKLKQFMYVHWGRRIMNHNVKRTRNIL